MRYWQVTTRRFSTHAQKLEQDGAWHPFASTPRSWYRVFRKKIIQRITFDSPEEEAELFPRLQDLEPLEGIMRSAGFREDIDIQLMEEGPSLIVLLGYEVPGMDLMTKRLKRDAVTVSLTDRVISLAVRLEAIDQREIVKAQEKALAARMLYQSLQTGGQATWQAALAAYDNLMKQLNELPPNPKKSMRKT